MWSGDMHGWTFFGGLWMFLFWAAFIALIVWGVSRLSQREGPSGKSNALDIAKERYAKGEISKEEFQQFKKDLS